MHAHMDDFQNMVTQMKTKLLLVNTKDNITL